MSFRSWRERNRLSQEKVAEMSGLSLRTVQRLEAGHRVSYASLRALAATFKVDVDLLERELYASNKSAEEFVEIPRWVRLLHDGARFDRPRLRRGEFHAIEALLLGSGVIVFIGSLFVASDMTAKALRTAAVIQLLAAYVISVFIRIQDNYKLWPGSGGVASETPQLQRTWRSIVAEYAFFLGAGILGTVMVYWLMF